MDNLFFCLNATGPIFLMMILGLFFRHIGWMDEEFASKMNKFVFKVPLPLLLFGDLATVDFSKVWNVKFVIFCFIVTLICIIISAGISCLWKDNSIRGEFIQAAYRSSAAILGIAFVKNIYGEATMAALMIVGTVPLYNVIAVVVLSLTAPQAEGQPKPNRKALLLKTLKNVATNPIILGIVVGMLWSILRIPQPVILSKSVSYLGNMATPLSLIALGASFQWQDAKGKLPATLGITATKLLLFCALFLPLAVAFGFRTEKLIAILVMLGSATTGSCFVMARNMGHRGTLTACSVMMTTLCSAFTLTMWLFILRTLQYI